MKKRFLIPLVITLAISITSCGKTKKELEIFEEEHASGGWTIESASELLWDNGTNAEEFNEKLDDFRLSYSDSSQNKKGVYYSAKVPVTYGSHKLTIRYYFDENMDMKTWTAVSNDSDKSEAAEFWKSEFDDYLGESKSVNEDNDMYYWIIDESANMELRVYLDDYETLKYWHVT
jgi:hypothetical protein